MRSYEEFIKEASAKQIGQDALDAAKELAPWNVGLTAAESGLVGVGAYRKARKKGLSKKDALKFAAKRSGQYGAVTLPALTALSALNGAVFNSTTTEPGVLNPHLKRSK